MSWVTGNVTSDISSSIDTLKVKTGNLNAFTFYRYISTLLVLGEIYKMNLQKLIPSLEGQSHIISKQLKEVVDVKWYSVVRTFLSLLRIQLYVSHTVIWKMS